MASPHVAGLMAMLLSESPAENISTKEMNERILESVTKFSLNGQLVTDDHVTPAPSLLAISSASTPSSHDSPPPPPHDSSATTGQPQILKFHGKALARNLVYIGAVPQSIGDNETEIIDPPSISGASSLLPLFSAHMPTACISACLIALSSLYMAF
jgi:hypothetical protein